MIARYSEANNIYKNKNTGQNPNSPTPRGGQKFVQYKGPMASHKNNNIRAQIHWYFELETREKRTHTFDIPTYHENYYIDILRK